MNLNDYLRAQVGQKWSKITGDLNAQLFDAVTLPDSEFMIRNGILIKKLCVEKKEAPNFLKTESGEFVGNHVWADVYKKPMKFKELLERTTPANRQEMAAINFNRAVNESNFKLRVPGQILHGDFGILCVASYAPDQLAMLDELDPQNIPVYLFDIQGCKTMHEVARYFSNENVVERNFDTTPALLLVIGGRSFFHVGIEKIVEVLKNEKF